MNTKAANKETISVADQSHASTAVNDGSLKENKGKEVIVTHVQGSKAHVAQQIFDRIGRTEPRKNVIAAFVSDAGLSPSGASTYYQNMKKAAGMVNKRVLVSTVVEQGGQTPTANSGAEAAETRSGKQAATA